MLVVSGEYFEGWLADEESEFETSEEPSLLPFWNLQSIEEK